MLELQVPPQAVARLDEACASHREKIKLEVGRTLDPPLQGVEQLLEPLAALVGEVRRDEPVADIRNLPARRNVATAAITLIFYSYV